MLPFHRYNPTLLRTSLECYKAVSLRPPCRMVPDDTCTGAPIRREGVKQHIVADGIGQLSNKDLEL